MKTAREVISYCYSHGRIVDRERYIIAINDLNRIESANRRMKSYLDFLYDSDGNVDFDDLELALKGTNNEPK